MPEAALMPEATSGMIPILLYMGWIIFRNNGSLVAKANDANMHNEPPIIRVALAPILLARLPAMMLPRGAVPIKAIV